MFSCHKTILVTFVFFLFSTSFFLRGRTTGWYSVLTDDGRERLFLSRNRIDWSCKFALSETPHFDATTRPFASSSAYDDIVQVLEIVEHHTHDVGA